MKVKGYKVVASLLCVAMLLSMLPMAVFAANSFTTGTDDYYKTISKKDWDLAPGITESEIILNNSEGSQRQVAHVVEVDLENEYTKVMPSYKGMKEGLESKDYGVQVMSQQAAYAEQNGYGNVVAAMNISLSWYSSDYYIEHPDLVGEPLGYLIMDGVQYTNSRGVTSGAQTCLVINYDEKNGVARPDDMDKVQVRSTSDPITGWEEQVIPANFGYLVKDGVNQYSKDHNNGASRSFIGVKADGTFVMVMNDGRQPSYSVGFTNYEMAEFMLSLGCVQAINGDGGGSSTFLSQRPGEELKLNCSPSDGAERATTHGILVISTAPSTGEFVRAQVSAPNDYYTPNSTVQFTAVGADVVGAAAEIPEEAYWKLADSSLGTIDKNGLFTSNGTTGKVTAQLVYEDAVVGEATVNVVIPDVKFTSSAMTVPYGKTFTLNVACTTNNGLNSVVTKDGDVTFELSDSEMGTITGNSYTTCTEDSGITEGTITVKCAWDESKTDTATVKFGKASQIVYDFEDGQLGTWWAGHPYSDAGKYGRFEKASVAIVDENTGKVRNGKYALAWTADFTDTTASGYKAVKFSISTSASIKLTDATAFGMWMYLPADVNGVEIEVGSGKKIYQYYPEKDEKVNGEGWYYIRIDKSYLASTLFKFTLYVTDADETYANVYDKFTIYVDDLTVDYSDATEDREIPQFTDVTVSTDRDSFVKMDGQTIDTNTFIVKAEAQEDLSGNYTGLDVTSAKVYVDGVQLEKSAYTCDVDGVITVPDITLPDGTHTFRFEILDNSGNMGFTTKQIVVNGENGDVAVVRRNASTVQPLAGSIEYFDVVAKNAENIETITLKLDLDSLSAWELQGTDVLYGFDMTYSVDERSNTANITLTKNDKATASGETVIASLPVRVWQTTSYLNQEYINAGRVNKSGATEAASVWSPDIMWTTDRDRYVRIELNAESIVVKYADETSATFSQKQINVITEHNRYRSVGYYQADGTYVAADSTSVLQGKTSTHVHTEGTPQDKAATCTEDGYEGRTFCAECGSVINWGTTKKATGHNYQASNGKMVCACGDVFEADGWVELNGNTMYFNGETFVTGLLRSEGTFYNMDQNGVAFDGTLNLLGAECTFDKGAFVESSTIKAAGLAGDTVYFVLYKNGNLVLGGEGETYDYATIGNIPWFTCRGLITTITIGEGVTAIGTREFIGCYNLTKVNFAENNAVYKLKALSFAQCTKLKSITIPEGVLAIYKTAFDKSYALENVTIPASMQAMFDTTFADLTKVKLTVVKGTYGETFAQEYGCDYTAIADPNKKNGVVHDADGKMEYKNGLIHDADGEVRYYVNNVATYAGLVQDTDGSYYYISGSTLAAIKNTTRYITFTNDLVPEGRYYFDADGKMQYRNGLIHDADGEVRYYVNNVATYAGLVQDTDGSYYYISGSTLAAIKNATRYITFTNDLVPEGRYTFGADGKMEYKNGVVHDADGEVRYYVNNVPTYAGVVEDYDGSYYYISGSTLTAIKNTTRYITFTNGHVEEGRYTFDADGKMQYKRGVVHDADGEVRYYENNAPTYAGLVEDNEQNYYYISGSTLTAIKNVSRYITFTNDLVPEGYYTFDADGKMIKD